MKAAQINNYGHADAVKVQEVAKPVPGNGQVLIEVHASSINPFDSMVREGFLKDTIPLNFPVTLGGDISGIITEIGEGVSDFKIGDKVYGQANVVGGASGAFAEFASTKSSQIGKMPANLSYTDSAAIVMTGLSAYQVIYEHMKLQAGQTILIHGGAGGIGSVAIQMAKHLGARVIATASGEGIAFAKDLGADEVIDYKLQKFEDLVTGVDAVFDTVGGETYDKSFVVVKMGGVIVSMTAQPNKELSEKFGVSAIYQSTHTSTEMLGELAKLVNEGVVNVRVDKVFTLDQIKQAFEARESGSVKGKLAIMIKD